MQPNNQAWRTQTLAFFARIGAVLDQADDALRDQIGRQMRPTMARLQGDFQRAIANPDARNRLLDTITQAERELTAIIGANWQPTPGSLGAKMAAAGHAPTRRH